MAKTVGLLLLLVTFLTGCITDDPTLIYSDKELEAIYLYPISDGGKLGYIDNKGNIVIKPKFSDASDFKEGLAVYVNSDRMQGYINKKGEVIIKPQFYEANKFEDGIAAVRTESNKNRTALYSYIDKSGNVIKKTEYYFITDFSEGLARVSVDGKKYG